MQKSILLLIILSFLNSACSRKPEPSLGIEPTVSIPGPVTPKNPVVLKVYVNGGGAVLVNGQVCKSQVSPCEVEVEKDSTENISVYPTANYYFMRWEGCSGPNGTVCAQNTKAGLVLKAYFSPKPPTVTCLANETLFQGFCYETEISCLIGTDIVGKQIFSMGQYGACEAKGCLNPEKHLEAGICVDNNQPCDEPLRFGTGTKQYYISIDGSAQYSTCQLTSCYSGYGYLAKENRCVPLSASCSDSFLNPGQKTFDVLLQKYGECQITGCKSLTEHVETISGSSFCTSNERLCSVPANGLSCKEFWILTLNSWGPKEITCKTNFIANDGQCVPQSIDGSRSQIIIADKDKTVLLNSAYTNNNTIEKYAKDGGPFILTLIARDQDGNLINNLNNIKLGLRAEKPSDADPNYSKSAIFLNDGTYQVSIDTLDNGIYRVIFNQNTLNVETDLSTSFSKLKLEMDFCLRSPDPETFPFHGKQVYNQAPYSNLTFYAICTAEQLASLGILYPETKNGDPNFIPDPRVKIPTMERMQLNYRLKKDIDLEPYYITNPEFMIGGMGGNFAGNNLYGGIFSGENHEIKNFKITNSNSSLSFPAFSYPIGVGLFAGFSSLTSAKQGIYNLKLTNFDINLADSPGVDYMPQYAGGLVGYVSRYFSNSIEIKNIYVQGKIEIKGYSFGGLGKVGGLVGSIDSISQYAFGTVSLEDIETNVDIIPSTIFAQADSMAQYGGLFGSATFGNTINNSIGEIKVKNIKLQGTIGDLELFSPVAGIGTAEFRPNYQSPIGESSLTFENVISNQVLKSRSLVVGGLNLNPFFDGQSAQMNDYMYSQLGYQTNFFVPYYKFKNALFVNTLSYGGRPDYRSYAVGGIVNAFHCVENGESYCAMFKIFGNSESGPAMDCSQFENVFYNDEITANATSGLMSDNCPGIMKSPMTISDYQPTSEPLKNFLGQSAWEIISNLPSLILKHLTF